MSVDVNIVNRVGSQNIVYVSQLSVRIITQSSYLTTYISMYRT